MKNPPHPPLSLVGHPALHLPQDEDDDDDVYLLFFLRL